MNWSQPGTFVQGQPPPPLTNQVFGTGTYLGQQQAHSFGGEQVHPSQVQLQGFNVDQPQMQHTQQMQFTQQMQQSQQMQQMQPLHGQQMQQQPLQQGQYFSAHAAEQVMSTMPDFPGGDMTNISGPMPTIAATHALPSSTPPAMHNDMAPTMPTGSFAAAQPQQQPQQVLEKKKSVRFRTESGHDLASLQSESEHQSVIDPSTTHDVGGAPLVAQLPTAVLKSKHLMQDQLKRFGLSTEGSKKELRARLARSFVFDDEASHAKQAEVTKVTLLSDAQVRQELRSWGVESQGERDTLNRRLVAARMAWQQDHYFFAGEVPVQPPDGASTSQSNRYRVLSASQEAVHLQVATPQRTHIMLFLAMGLVACLPAPCYMMRKHNKTWVFQRDGTARVTYKTLCGDKGSSTETFTNIRNIQLHTEPVERNLKRWHEARISFTADGKEVFLTNEPNAYTQNDEMFAVLALLRQLLGEARYREGGPAARRIQRLADQATGGDARHIEMSSVTSGPGAFGTA